MNRLTIERPKGQGWKISQGRKYHDQLTLGELLEQIISYHHAGLPRYPMKTAKQWRAERARWRKNGAKRRAEEKKKTPKPQQEK